MKKFEKINRAYNEVFKTNNLSVGIVVPVENYAQSQVPTMQHHLKRAKLVEQLGFKALWIRDVPFNVPTFGDAGQTYDPFTYLGYLAGQTNKIALGISSIALPLHHPLHVAKSAATIDQLSNGRLILGVASGDRFEEYPAMAFDYEKRGEQFRDAFHYIRKTQDSFPAFKNDSYGTLNGQVDVLPKATAHKIPMLLTGNSRQSVEWIAEHADGWMYYPRNFYMQEHNISQFRNSIPSNQNYDKPFMQPLYVDLQEKDDFKPQSIQLGFRTGIDFIIEYFHKIKALGVNHVAINLRFNAMNIEKTLEKIAEKLLPQFHMNEKK